MFGLQLRLWLIGVIAFVIGFGVVLPIRTGWIDWSWSGWTVVGDLFTFLAVVAAVVAIWYARRSLQAARDTVQPLKDMVIRLEAAVNTLENIEASQDATAGTMAANLKLAQQIRADEARVAILDRCLRVRSLHYRLRSAQQGYERSRQVSLEAVTEWEDRLLTLLEDFRGAVAFLDKDAFPGAWEDEANIGFHSPQGLTGSTGKALADVEKKIVELRTEGSSGG